MEVRFLEINIDLVAMECRLLEGKLQNLCEMVGQVRRAKKFQLQQVKFLLGMLNFAC